VKKKKASEPFAEAIAAADYLSLLPGMSAIKKNEGKGRIHQGKGAVLGSVAIDDDCLKAYPQAARWDYVVGVEVEKKAKAFFIEVHSAETSESLQDEGEAHLVARLPERDAPAAAREASAHAALGGLRNTKH
jgi:hypothetical protein